MDRRFLDYYEGELGALRKLAGEFAEDHPNAAGALRLTPESCADPYVERLLEGVAFLSARTRMKLDLEAGRHVRILLESLYPDAVSPGPAMTLAELTPGPQVAGMPDGHVVRKGTRLVAALTETSTTRAVYVTGQDVRLWPIAVDGVRYLSGRSALRAAGLGDRQSGEAAAGLLLELRREGPGSLSELSLDEIVLHLRDRTSAPDLFDAIFGTNARVFVRGRRSAPFSEAAPPRMVGLQDDEALLPPARQSYTGFRVLREYFLMPDRFYFARLSGLRPAVREARDETLQILIAFGEDVPGLADLAPDHFALFSTPIVNLFERECDVVTLGGDRNAHIVHVDRKRPFDFEIYRVIRVEDVEATGPDAVLNPLYTLGQHERGAHVYTLERRPTRTRGRSVYRGDDVFISVSRTPGPRPRRPIRRLDIRALCTNRDLPMLDPRPELGLETGDPVAEVRLHREFRRPQSALSLPLGITPERERVADDLTWRWIAQLSLNLTSLTDDWEGADPIRAVLDLYAEGGEPDARRHVAAFSRVRSRRVLERLALPGPICFGQGTEITLEIDDGKLGGVSKLLLSALLAQVFARQCAINSFVRTRTVFIHTQREVEWPMVPGVRATL